jgi:signal transduction histidine kinase
MQETQHSRIDADILIAEDAPHMLQLLAILMTSAGYTVRKATNGKEAMALLGETLPDMVLLDANMPVMDGFEVCRRLKADAATADIPVIFLSGLDEAQDITKAFELQAVDYIVKPYRPAEVLSRVRTHLELRALRLRLEEMVHTRTRQLQDEVLERRQAEADLLESRQQLSRLGGHMEDVREAERAHIAREIHDELGQSLTVARIDLTRLRNHLDEPPAAIQAQIDAIVELLEQASNTARAISENLRPGMLDLIGLGPAIEHHVKRFGGMTGITCIVKMSNGGEFFVDDRVAIAIFRILQEALTNIARHAQAGEVNVHLVELGTEIILIVQDNGRGMPSSLSQDARSHYGLLGMRERARLLGGHVVIDSAPGKGTRIEASLPVTLGENA